MAQESQVNYRQKHLSWQQRSLPIVALVLREYRDDSYVKGESDNSANDLIVLGCMRKAYSCSQQR